MGVHGYDNNVYLIVEGGPQGWQALVRNGPAWSRHGLLRCHHRRGVREVTERRQDRDERIRDVRASKATAGSWR